MQTTSKREDENTELIIDNQEKLIDNRKKTQISTDEIQVDPEGPHYVAPVTREVIAEKAKEEDFILTRLYKKYLYTEDRVAGKAQMEEEMEKRAQAANETDEGPRPKRVYYTAPDLSLEALMTDTVFKTTVTYAGVYTILGISSRL